MPPIVSVVGKSESGKTTLIEKLVGELKARGYRVATIKHTHHGFSMDQPGKDSWRHLQAGSEATAISSRDGIILMKPMAEEPALDEVARLLGENCDIILAEGYKQGSTPKIEVHRSEVGPPLGNTTGLIAIVTDEPLSTKAKQFSHRDVGGLVELLVRDFIMPQRERLALYIDNAPIALNSFSREIISTTLVAMVSSLKGGKEAKSLDIFLRRPPRQG